MSNEQSENWQTLVKEREFNDLLLEWNKKINLVSRRKNDVTDLIEDSKLFLDVIDFTPGVKILDLGTGGGFPGIVIAIHHPEAQLTLVDSIQKKINVVTDIIKKLKLTNVHAICSRAEELVTSVPRTDTENYSHYFDYITARSVAVLQDLCRWSKPLLAKGGKLVTVKGGDISGEIHKTRKLDYIKNVKAKSAGERVIVTVEF
jgi:16S rRNA (guanine527-N7)-methyltransferase